MSLKGKAAIVTGSTSGIGKAIAEAFAAQGCNVMLNGFGDKAAIEAQRVELAKTCNVAVAYHAADMTKPAEIADLVTKTQASFGSVDILVNNAGIQHVAPIENFPPEKWEAIIAINLSSTFYAIHHALPLMKAAKWGRIINIASTHGLVASAQKVAYVAAKHGIVGLTKVVGMECADSGVTCNAICPGWVLTPLVQKQIDDIAQREGLAPDAARAKLLREKQPSLDFATPEQIGEAVRYLCSPGSAQVRGIALPIDGGWTSQ
jgi:3-hydroxybutyrate dehydrogenase